MNVLRLQRSHRKFPQFEQGEIFSLQDAFRKLDIDEKGYVDETTVIKSAQQSERQPYDIVRQALKEVELDSSRRVEFEDYVDLISKLRATPGQGRSGDTSTTAVLPGNGTGSRHVSKGSIGGKIHVQGSSANVTHTINEDERTEFTRHINAVLAGDPDIGQALPFPTDTFEMFDKCKDGLVLAKLINDSVPDTIDERVLNKSGKKIKELNAFHMTENNNIVINSAKGIGCSVVNIGSGDIIEVREHLILGLIWQIIRRGLLGKIDIKLHPELYRLLEDDETLEQFLRLPPEQILLRWFNYHLSNAKWNRRVTNFSADVKDGENYAVLLNQLAPDICSRGPLQTKDLLQRAEQVLDNADRLGCRKFLTPTSLVAGNPKLNLAFVANLFNTIPGLDPITEEEKLEVEDFDAEGEREARVFTLWLNSLDVQPTVNSLFDDLRDGTVLLQAYDKVIPGTVNWRHVNKPPVSGGEMLRFKAVENTNYATELGKHIGFSLVGVQGADITDGQRTLTLGLVWQLMRRDITNTLLGLAQRMGKREITDSEMIRWANDMSQKGGRNSSIRSFKDQSIGSGIFLLDVLNGMKSSYVDYELVTLGRTDEEAYANAKLSISIARKLGATIWLVPEDICQVRSRLVTTFIARPNMPCTDAQFSTGEQDTLQWSKGEDHTVTHTHRLSFHRYPNDCPLPKVRWFYAVDSPKRKSMLWDRENKDTKPLPPPKKFVPFSSRDSQAIEAAFQKLSDIENACEHPSYTYKCGQTQRNSIKVAVNEDCLFDVDVEKRELSPAYWAGPVYEVRRGTWFLQEGSAIKPCEENLASQLEEGYLKVKPWRVEDLLGSSARPSSAMGFQAIAPNTPRSRTEDTTNIAPAAGAVLTNDDFMSRMSTTVYQKLGGVPGTRVIRGFAETKKGKDARKPTGQALHRPSEVRINASESSAYNFLKPDSQRDIAAETISKPALERQLSSLADGAKNEPELEEQAYGQEEEEMEDSREADNDDREREIDHLVLVTHGIGQRLGLRLESINFIHDVNVLRKTMKSVYKASSDLQALNSAFPDEQTNCRVQVLPVCWRHLIDFPYRAVKQPRKEFDLADADFVEDDQFPSLADITLDNVPAVRNLISDLAMDVLLYQSAYCEHISNIVSQESNRILKLFKERNPSFKGSVSFCGHSLGSAILFDILCSEQLGSGLRHDHTTPSKKPEQQQLDFDCEELFCLGSPIALFQMLKGNTIAGRSTLHASRATKSFYSEGRTEGSRVGQSVGSLWNNFTSGVASSLLNRSLGLGSDDATNQPSSSGTFQSQQSQLSPNTDSGIPRRDQHLTLIESNLETLYEGFQKSRRECRDVSSESKGGISGEYDEFGDHMRKIRLEDAKVRALNSSGRVDYSIQE
ncbi:uncharacterized protein ATNIH1004_001194 [Aspergillus tanneri]|uniref:Fimbrin n=1 Tax=Aspergillus tanneri TaxID=1220188 RepID=A0A5M9N3L6_9EURO|nr:uncharacterized protein ATNIH1004_001194 [Aspergillus tanneri]KAA8652290.1 hypothetical protein ATNIH1004_001194 [Aspergillus tanneri]